MNARKLRGDSPDDYEGEVASKLAIAVGNQLTVLEAAALMDLLTDHRFHFSDGTEVNNPNIFGAGPGSLLSMHQAAWVASRLVRDPKVTEVDVDGCHAVNAAEPFFSEARNRLLQRISESPDVAAHRLCRDDYEFLKEEDPGSAEETRPTED